MGLSRIILKLIRRYRLSMELSRYDDFTIAEYFRQQGAEIGENNRLMIRSLGQEPYLITIGNHCSISAGVIFVNHDGGGWIFTDEDPSLQRFGRIDIRDNCFIGINCTILPNVTIGPNAVVGAGSMVTKNVPPNSVVCGNPARVVKTAEEYRKKIIEVWRHQKPDGYFRDAPPGSTLSPARIQALKDSEYALLMRHLKETLMGRRAADR